MCPNSPWSLQVMGSWGYSAPLNIWLQQPRQHIAWFLHTIVHNIIVVLGQGRLYRSSWQVGGGFFVLLGKPIEGLQSNSCLQADFNGKKASHLSSSWKENVAKCLWLFGLALNFIIKPLWKVSPPLVSALFHPIRGLPGLWRWWVQSRNMDKGWGKILDISNDGYEENRRFKHYCHKRIESLVISWVSGKQYSFCTVVSSVKIWQML